MRATSQCTSNLPANLSAEVPSAVPAAPPTPPSNKPPSAFTPAFLANLRGLENPPSARESALRGPWEVEELALDGGRLFAVSRRAEPFRQGGGVFGAFPSRSVALQLAAVLPAVGAPVELHLNRRGRRLGYALHDGQDFLGHVARKEEPLLPMLHVVRRLVSDPDALALLLESAGPELLAILGRALHRRMARRAG
jgi:hypothetical protein